MRQTTEDTNTLLAEGIPALAGLRHQALYEGFGYDLDAYDAVVNRENPYGEGLDKRDEILRDLALELLGAYLELAEFFFAWCDEHAKGDSQAALTQRVAISTFYPAFEFDVPEYASGADSHGQRVRALTDRLESCFTRKS
ncbi:hypothetical protein ACFV2N_14760 [Streptomyces sp. NPDC059680]|uniref:hypothetical protein n=1 Tax=Streptomyces sp. NPDC059680 TaxID=3346904 RepID=UPI00367BE4F6